MKTFKYQIPGARYQPSVRLGRWDGCANFFTLGGGTYINLLPEIIPILEEYNYDFEIEDLRDYRTSFEFDEVDAHLFSHIIWGEGHRLEGQPITLNDHQVVVVNEFLRNPQSLSEAATGAGKTVVTAALSHSVEKYGRSIVIVPNKSLVTQTEDDYLMVGLDVGVYYGERKDIGKKHTICTWQSLNNVIKATKDGSADVPIGEFIEDVVCVIVDESHQAKADVLKMMLSGPFSKVPIRWGLTGTIPKEKFAEVTLRVCLGEVVSKVSASHLQELGHLSRCHVNVLQLKDYGEYKNYQEELGYLVKNVKRLKYIANRITRIKESGNTLVLVDRRATGDELVRVLTEMGVKSVFVNGSTKAIKRKEEYTNFRYEDGTVIVATYGVASVGISIDRIFNLVLIEPGKSFVRVIQSIGRGLRRAVDKDYVDIWDITSTCKYSKRHLTARKAFYKDAEYPFTIDKVEWN